MTRKISSIDDLSITLNWDNQLTAYLIRSCPYITLNVNNSKVKFKTIHAILSVKIENQRCLIQLNNGQLWAFYTNNNNMAYTNTLNEIQMNINYTGILRIVLIPEPFDNNLKVIDQFYTSYPIGGIVNYEFPTSNQAYLHFNFKKGGSNLPLLMLALPHHIDCMINPSSNNLIGYNCLKGNLTAIISDQWTLYEELNNQIQWFSNNPLNNNYINSITNALLQDINIEIDSNIKDPYFFGKGLAKIARLCLIAESVNKKELISNLLIKIKKYIEPWLSGNNENKFIYDNYWGGILTINGYDDSGADFGNGNYNDHHFHYGYFLYACAIIGKYDPGWVIWWREPIQVLIRDFASPSKNDIYFPQFRYKDWFDGHSWASGLFEFGDGKNQESTSESVNAYYSMYLIAIILQNNDLINISNLLLTSEIRSSKKYWHMTNNTSVYPVPFKNNKTVGVLWNTKVDYATWFGKNVEFIHCIQMLPFTPISHLLLDKQWVQECYPILSTALTRQDPPLSEGWKTFLFMAQAVFDKEKAVVNFNNSNKGMDDGNTLSNTLYWFATQQ
ncbi:glycoside hydrolase [Neoconidiobolus thromboides FSU 785]|nr:glycoside hydrolase [Neoconidiobolus thromboides FSU 785]